MTSRAMTFYIVLACYMALGQDIFQGNFFRQGKPCFETVKSACNRSLAESFTPKSPNVVNLEPRTYIFLFTPTNPDVAESLHECGGALPPGSTFDPNADTEIFIHGWLDGVCRTGWMRECKEQLWQRAISYNSSYNVILVDWTWGNTPDMIVAELNSRIVGEQVGFVINNIMLQTGTGPEKFHVIAQSAGVIASGFVGRSVKGLRRITALDPNYSPFAHAPPNKRITFRDAEIVDVIHSSGLNCSVVAFGDGRRLGHADFYPNGGVIQSSCIYQVFESILNGDILSALGRALDPRLCWHMQAIYYYKLSINPSGCQYVGVASDSYSRFLNGFDGAPDIEWAVMGMDYGLYHKNDGKRRKYYLTTRNFCPYYDNSYLGNKQFPFKTSCTV